MAFEEEDRRIAALARLASEQGWSTGAYLGLRTGRVFLALLEACPDLSLIGVGLVEREDFERLNQAVVQFGARATLFNGRANEALGIAGDASLDFVLARDVQNIATWRSKLKPDGFAIALPPVIWREADFEQGKWHHQ